MGSKQSTAAKKRVAFMSTIEPEVSESRRKRTVIPSKSAIPTPFSKFQIFSDEWNLCGGYDAFKRVSVVSDVKLQRKRQPHLLVDKCVIMRPSEALWCVRNELEMLMFLVRYAQLHIGFMHPNVIQLRGFFSFRKKMHVFVEFCELGSLERAYLLDPNPLLRLNFAPSETEVRDAMWQIVSAVAFLHANGVAHGDIALDNIFVTSANVLKLGDLDHAVFVGTENQTQAVRDDEPLRRVYGAPELYAPEHGARPLVDLQKADMWAVGIVLMKLVTKKPIFDGATPRDKGFQLFKDVGLRSYLRALFLEQTAICKFSNDMLELLEGLLEIDPCKRLSAADALQTPWLQTFVHEQEEGETVDE